MLLSVELSAKQKFTFTPKFETVSRCQLYDPGDNLLLNHYYNHKKLKPELEYISLLQPEFYPELLSESFLKKRYLDKNQRKEYEVDSTGEQFLDSKGYPLQGEHIYGLLPDNRLYCAPCAPQSKDDFTVRNHSHLVAGLPVLAAGHAYFSNGRLVTLSNNSGHYKPSTEKMLQALTWFSEKSEFPFLYEDHSGFDLKKDHYGIKHYKITDVLGSLNNLEVQALSQIQILDFIKQNSNFLEALESKPAKEAPIGPTGYERSIVEAPSEFSVEVQLIQAFTGLNKDPNHSRFNRSKDKMTSCK